MRLASLIILTVITCSATSRAAELTQLQAGHILAVAYGQYHGPPSLLDNPPTVHLTPQEALRTMYHCPTCVIEGLYLKGEIYIWDELDFAYPYAATVLLHEYIHHFQ